MQALTIRSEVNGCLEGVFALGQIYVLASRVTDPANLFFVGLPPKDLLADVEPAWTAAGLDADACFAAAAAVTEEWEWTRSGDNGLEMVDPSRHLQPQYEKERRVPVHLKTLHEILNPQPTTAQVLHGLLDWIKSSCSPRESHEHDPCSHGQSKTHDQNKKTLWQKDIQKN